MMKPDTIPNAGPVTTKLFRIQFNCPSVKLRRLALSCVQE